jgi:hypothetical protein
MRLGDADGLSMAPEEIVRLGLISARSAGLIEVHEGGVVLLETAQRGGGAERQRRYREKNGAVTRYGRKRDAALRNVTSQGVTQFPTSGYDSSEISDPEPEERENKPRDHVRYGVLRNVTSRVPEVPNPVVAQTAAAAVEAWAERQHALLSGRLPADAPGEAPPQSGGTHTENVAPEPARKRKARSKPEPPEEALTLGILLIEYIATNHPTSKVARLSERDKVTTSTAWADDIRLLHQSDKLSYGEIQGMIHWSQKSEFWSGVILSGRNLRRHWDKMAAQRGRNTTKRETGVGRAEPAPHNTYKDGEVPV